MFLYMLSQTRHQKLRIDQAVTDPKISKLPPPKIPNRGNNTVHLVDACFLQLHAGHQIVLNNRLLKDQDAEMSI